MDRNTILIGLVIFYTIFLGLIGLWSPADIETTEGDVSDSGFLNWLSGLGGFVGDVGSLINTIFTTITGFPDIVNVVLFSPLILMAGWLIVDLLIYITPFIGG